MLPSVSSDPDKAKTAQRSVYHALGHSKSIIQIFMWKERHSVLSIQAGLDSCQRLHFSLHYSQRL